VIVLLLFCPSYFFLCGTVPLFGLTMTRNFPSALLAVLLPGRTPLCWWCACLAINQGPSHPPYESAFNSTPFFFPFFSNSPLDLRIKIRHFFSASYHPPPVMMPGRIWFVSPLFPFPRVASTPVKHVPCPTTNKLAAHPTNLSFSLWMKSTPAVGFYATAHPTFA